MIIEEPQHHPVIEYYVDSILSQYGREFKFSVELGCGKGGFAQLLKKYTNYLIGIDINYKFLKEAKNHEYDELIWDNILDYQIPVGADSIFMFEVIEHLTKEEGLSLIMDVGDRFIMISTPSKFFSAYGEHQSLWTEDEFINLNFYVWKLPVPYKRYKVILAVKGF